MMVDSTTASKSTIRRHNSISVITPNKLSPPAIKPPIRTSSLDFELHSLKSPFTSYTSLRDMLASPVNSSTASSATINSGNEISIRNRLVKQVARAYLQPTCPASVGNTVVWNKLITFSIPSSSANAEVTHVNDHILNVAIRGNKVNQEFSLSNQEQIDNNHDEHLIRIQLTLFDGNN